MTTIFQTRTRLLFEVFGPLYDQLTAHDLWRQQNVALAELACARLGRTPQALLDVGCGTGVGTWSIAAQLPGVAVTGVDLTPSMIARATDPSRPRPDVTAPPRFLAADAARLPLDSGAFDVVVGASVLYLVPDPLAVLRELRRVLRPGGALVFLEPSAGASLRRAARHGVANLSVAARAPQAATRLVAAMIAWRAVSAAAARPTPEALIARARDANFVDVTAADVLGGLGVHLIASADRG